ncbi:MAG TPA: adenylate/guanylate cyclase domain-containing protein [Burkholderiales bacterium]|nr:adenylate/guanylate cyclase domain-containing protein [Burkholderiales bacterium]
MKCSRCNHENAANQKFCGDCGARLSATCPACGTASAPDQKFCGECGARLTEAASSPRFVSPQSYTPKHLADRILHSKEALEGERKQVTVLFADLKGSMELISERDPEEARKILDPVLERMMEAVHRYEGTVNQVMGDGVMALFGAPLALEDHAVRACYAALAMQEAVKQYSERTRAAEGIEVQIRAGLNSGEVVVRAIGNDLHMDYSAIGQTTHLAARMEQLALAGTIRITSETLRLAEGFVQVKPLGAVPVKGLAGPIEVFELTGAAASRTRMQAMAARGLTRFVGRQVEMDALSRALRQAAGGSGQLVAVVGEPGVGKSRLYWEFTRSHRTQGWMLLESGSVSYGKANTYEPLIDLLKTYFQIENRDDMRKMREKVTGRALSLDRALEADLSPLLSLLNVTVDDALWAALDPPQRRLRILEACKRLLLRESQVQPLLLVLEDLHWLDSETQAFLNSLVDSLPSARVLLMVNYRPEYQHDWSRKTFYTQLRVDPLPQESAEELLGSLVGSDPALAPVKQLLLRQTERNPFFLEESVRTLVESGALAGTSGAYRLTRPLDNVRVPSTVQAVLAARIDRLGVDDKRLLQTAAVIGKDVPLAILQAVSDLPERVLREGLGHLQSAEFVYEARLFPDPEYTFKHALTHEVAYANLLQEQRRGLHAKIVVAIEATYPGRLEEHVEQLGHHALRGELWERAAEYMRQAGEKAAARSALRAAAAFFEQALDALTHMPKTRETIVLAIDLRFRLRTVLAPLGEFERIFARLSEAQSLAQGIEDEDRLGWVSCYLTHYYTLSRSPESGVQHGNRAILIAEVLGDFPLLVASRLFTAAAYAGLAEYAAARDALIKNIDEIPREREREHFRVAGPVAAWSRNTLVSCLAEQGDFAEGLSQGKEALRISLEANFSYTLAGSYYFLGYLQLHRGDLGNAIDMLERGFELCRTRDLPWQLPQISVALGCAYAVSGRVNDARALLPQIAGGVSGLGAPSNISWLGNLRLLTVGPEEAIAESTRTLEASRRSKERAVEAWTLHLNGNIEMARPNGDRIAAEQAFRDSLALALAHGMRPLVAHCHLGLGKLFTGTGEKAKARDHLGMAAAMMRKMEMGIWLEQAETALAQSNH